MAGRRAAREESFDSLPESETSNAENEDAFDADDEDQDGPQLLTIGDVHRALHPLQTTAERVGKQVEKFAEALDRLSPRNQGKTNVKAHEVLPLVCEYEKIASDTVKRLRRYHEPERQELLKQSWKESSKKSNGEPTPTNVNDEDEPDDTLVTTVHDLQHWEQERQTWRLLKLMLQSGFPMAGQDPATLEKEAKFTRPKVLSKIHRYSSEHEVWSHFLAKNDDMWEKNVVVEWLKSTADSSGQDIDTIVEQLESGADRGSGLWAHGWLYSKEALKGVKRLRSWPQPLEPDTPGIETSLLNAEKTAGLVTQLDPDAVSRQGRSVEKEDLFFERAIWLACWEMIRRGHSWESIREWCRERTEVWRALSMRGDPRLPYDSNSSKPDAGWTSRTLWRKMCASAARNGGIDEYENAVYGALSGDLPSVEKTVRNWDDYVFAHYNSQLLQSFDVYVQKSFPERLPKAMTFKLGRPDIGSLLPPPTTSGSQIWESLLSMELTKEEAQLPMKMLQGSLIAKKTPNYLWDQGLRLGRLMLEGETQSKKLMRTDEPAEPKGPTANIAIEDYDLLRILTHVSFIYQELEPLPEDATAIENIVVAYIDYLGKAGKQQLLPLYASRLSEEGSVICMARQLPYIVDFGERQTVLRLMQQYELNVPRILLMQLVLITLDKPPDPRTELGFPPLRILEPLDGKKNALPQIKRNFIGNEIGPEDEDLINGMDWYLLLGKHWKETMYAGSLIYKYFLLTGSLAAARELSNRASFSAISLNKTETILGESIDLGIFSEEDEYEEPNLRQSTRKQAPKTQKSQPDQGQDSDQKQKGFLLSEANTFRDFENFAFALDALEHWKTVADEYANQADPRHAKAWKNELQKAHDAVVSCVTPLLDGWLQYPSTDTEQVELESLRTAYLPEIVLAYNTVLSIGGQFLSRDVLLKTMDLAALIAAEGSDLAVCFIKAGRMAELVDALAMASKTILRADEMGAKQGKKARKAVEGLGLWTVGKNVDQDRD